MSAIEFFGPPLGPITPAENARVIRGLHARSARMAPRQRLRLIHVCGGPATGGMWTERGDVVYRRSAKATGKRSPGSRLVFGIWGGCTYAEPALTAP